MFCYPFFRLKTDHNIPERAWVPESRGQEAELRETHTLGEKETFAVVHFADLR